MTMRKKVLIALYLGTVAGAVVASAFSVLGYALLIGASLFILTRKELDT